jgi:hypothetical protein
MEHRSYNIPSLLSSGVRKAMISVHDVAKIPIVQGEMPDSVFDEQHAPSTKRYSTV